LVFADSRYRRAGNNCEQQVAALWLKTGSKNTRPEQSSYVDSSASLDIYRDSL
jgi:hypothetical protein